MFSLDTKILIVDDMLTMRKIVKKALQTIGFKDITDHKNGEEAWEDLQNSDYQLVISDWNMPKCTGIELLEKVRTNGELKEIPFILLTAETDTAQVQEALQKKVDNYIVKPFSVKTLEEKLQQTYGKVGDRYTAKAS